jgi:O-Antigen ligase
MNRNSPNLTSRKSKFNIYELNLIIILTGYPIISFLPDFYGVDTRIITVPFRVFALVLSILAFFMGVNNKREFKKTVLPRLLILFYIIYLLKIFYNLAFGPEIKYALSKEEYIFWSFGVCFIPILSVEFINKIDFINVARKMIYILFAVMVISIFNNKEALKSTIETRLDANSALNSITYGHLGVTLCLLSVYFLGLSKNKLFYILSFVLGTYVMLISGSRSPIVALVLCLVFMALVRRNKWVIGILITLGIVIVTSFTIFIGFIKKINPIIVERITALVTDKEQSQRNKLFNDAIDDFLQSPVIGKHFLLSHGVGEGFYPHNLLVEAFMALGLIGGCFFLYLVFAALRVCIGFLKKNFSFSWVSLLFIQAFILGLASGAFWGSQAFWILMMLLFSIYDRQKILQRKIRLNNKILQTAEI